MFAVILSVRFNVVQPLCVTGATTELSYKKCSFLWFHSVWGVVTVSPAQTRVGKQTFYG